MIHSVFVRYFQFIDYCQPYNFAIYICYTPNPLGAILSVHFVGTHWIYIKLSVGYLAEMPRFLVWNQQFQIVWLERAKFRITHLSYLSYSVAHLFLASPALIQIRKIIFLESGKLNETCEKNWIFNKRKHQNLLFFRC